MSLDQVASTILRMGKVVLSEGKACNLCRQIKSISEFYTFRTSIGNVLPEGVCKVCRIQQVKASKRKRHA